MKQVGYSGTTDSAFQKSVGPRKTTTKRIPTKAARRISFAPRKLNWSIWEPKPIRPFASIWAE